MRRLDSDSTSNRTDGEVLAENDTVNTFESCGEGSEAKRQKLRIAYLIDTIACDTAGTQKQLIETIRRLDGDRFDAQIVCLHSSPWLKQNALPCELAVLDYHGFVKPNLPEVLWRLRRILEKSPVHILHTFFEDSIFIAYFATVGIRRRFVILSSRRDMGLTGSRPWYHSLYRMVLPVVNRGFDGVLCNGEEIRQWVARTEQLPLAKICVVRNGISAPLPAGPAPELLARHPDALWIGVVANLTPVKRIDLFLLALHVLIDKRPDTNIRGVVLGEGPEREKLERLASDLRISDRVHFPGAVRDVSQYLHHLDVGVLCSEREGFSNAVLEYMSHGLPVVVTDVGGNASLVEQGTGICVPPGDAAALSAGLGKLADSPPLRAKMGRGGREKVTRDYSWQRSMAELERYYLDIARRKLGFS